jgi:flagellin-like protein
MAFTKKNDEAVSPVIGVILMVAVTVILAAVIAAFVFGMAGNLQKGKTVAITAARTGTSTGTITNMGGPDVGSLSSLAISGDVTGTLGTSVGATADLGSVGSGSERVIVTGTFNDGSTVVLLDTHI